MTSVQAAKQKGREWEKRVAAYLSEWWPYAERRRPRGSKDAGDVAGVPFVVEAKNPKDWGSQLGGFQDEAATERGNAGADFAFVAIPRKRKDTGQAYAITTLEEMCELLWKAGYR